MISQNHFLDQEKSYSKILNFRMWFCLPYPLDLNTVCFTCDIHFSCFTKTVKILISMLLLTIHKYFTICNCSKPMSDSLYSVAQRPYVGKRLR